jgi:thioredoxin
MKKSAILVLTAVIFMVAGGAIIGIAAYKKRPAGPDFTQIQIIDEENFETAVVEQSKNRPILLDFYADWCFPCRLLDPVLKEAAKELEGRAVIGKVNHDKSILGRRFGVAQLPMMFIIKDGEVRQSFTGYQSKEAILRALKQHGG